ncbi:MAG: hypothetical protein DPW16_14600 [Chloroflexi bacterium]|nr:hypothetical protein [Chloroflexota bacterium]
MPQLPVPLRKHLPLIVLLGVFLLVVRVYGWAITPFEGPDEPSHFAYILKVRETGELPDPDADFDTMIVQQVSQAPLYYVSAALFSQLRDFGPLDAEAKGNPWRGYPAPETSRDNRNFYLMSKNHVLTEGEQHLADALRWTRLLSAVYGMVAVAGVYWAGLALWPQQRGWALLAAMGLAFNPQALHGFAVVSNDVGAMAFGAWVLAGSLHLLRDWQNRRWLIGTGICMGLAALSKTSGLSLWLVPMVALGLGWLQNRANQRPAPLSQLLAGWLILVGLAAIIGGWWYVRGAILFDDPFGTQPHSNMPWGIREHPSMLEKWPEFRDRIPELTRELWAQFGWRSVFIQEWGYVLPIVLIVIGVLGWIKALFRNTIRKNTTSNKPPQSTSANFAGIAIAFILRIKVEIILLLTLTLGIISLLQWSTISHVVPGRLLLPYYPALVLLVVMGLRQFPRTRLWVAGGLGGVVVIIVPTTIYPAFGRPPLTENPPENLMGEVLDYGQASFLGFKVDDTRIHLGDTREFTLCWQAEDAASSGEKIPMPYAFTLHVIGPDDEVVGRRESYPGLGNYTLWDAGKSFCDTFGLPIGGELKEGQIYRLSLTLLEFETGNRLPNYAPDGSQLFTTYIGSLIAPAAKIDPAELNSAPFRFEGISLVEYTVSHDTENLQLTLTWGTSSRPADTYKLFVHIVDASGQQVAQLDPLAGGEQYPTWAWDAEERIPDVITLPLSGLPVGEYQVKIGLYQAESFTRLHATDAVGNILPDDTATLDTFRIE